MAVNSRWWAVTTREERWEAIWWPPTHSSAIASIHTSVWPSFLALEHLKTTCVLSLAHLVGNGVDSAVIEQCFVKPDSHFKIFFDICLISSTNLRQSFWQPSRRAVLNWKHKWSQWHFVTNKYWLQKITNKVADSGNAHTSSGSWQKSTKILAKKVGNIIVLAKKLPKMNRWRTGGTPTQAGTLGSWRHCSTQHVCHKSFTLSGLKLIFSGKYFVQWRLLPIVEYHEDIPSSRQKLINTWKIQKSASHLNRHEVLLIGQQRWAQCHPS